MQERAGEWGNLSPALYKACSRWACLYQGKGHG